MVYFCHFTIVRGHPVQQVNGVQMFGCGNGEGQNIANSLVKTRVGSSTVAHRLVLVLQVILDVPHLMVHSEELLHCYCGALLDPNEEEIVTQLDFWLIKLNKQWVKSMLNAQACRC